MSELRQHLKAILMRLPGTGDAYILTQYSRPKAVLVGYDDYAALTEQPRSGHPYVEREPGLSGGEPCIRGTRISVRHVVQQVQAGLSVEEILAAHPHLTAAQVHAALSYYYDHQAQIDQLIAEHRLDRVIADQGLALEELAEGMWLARREAPR